MKIGTIVLFVVILFFAFPILNQIPLPQSFDPQDIGRFVGGALRYWQDLLASISG